VPWGAQKRLQSPRLSRTKKVCWFVASISSEFDAGRCPLPFRSDGAVPREESMEPRRRSWSGESGVPRGVDRLPVAKRHARRPPEEAREIRIATSNTEVPSCR